jgi:hypothetical protein
MSGCGTIPSRIKSADPVLNNVPNSLEQQLFDAAIQECTNQLTFISIKPDKYSFKILSSDSLPCIISLKYHLTDALMRKGCIIVTDSHNVADYKINVLPLVYGEQKTSEIGLFYLGKTRRLIAEVKLRFIIRSSQNDSVINSFIVSAHSIALEKNFMGIFESASFDVKPGLFFSIGINENNDNSNHNSLNTTSNSPTRNIPLPISKLNTVARTVKTSGVGCERYSAIQKGDDVGFTVEFKDGSDKTKQAYRGIVLLNNRENCKIFLTLDNGSIQEVPIDDIVHAVFFTPE